MSELNFIEYTVREFRQKISQALDEAKADRTVIIERRGERFVLRRLPDSINSDALNAEQAENLKGAPIKPRISSGMSNRAMDNFIEKNPLVKPRFKKRRPISSSGLTAHSPGVKHFSPKMKAAFNRHKRESEHLAELNDEGVVYEAVDE